MKEFRVGVIGLGQRGYDLTEKVLSRIEGVKITALCDTYQDRVDKCAKAIKNSLGYEPCLLSTDYHEVIASDEVDTVMIFAAWEIHIPAAIEAMKAKKPVGVEVGGAYSTEQCWELVRAYEETRTPIMMLENCCYGRRELMALNMANLGLFGKIVHCDGGYMHDLREEISGGIKNRHYRYRNYKNRNCENYPTHELGPIAKILNINHGNRMLALTSTASGADGLHEYIMENYSGDRALVNTKFMQSDIVTTSIKCAGGETIRLTLDTTLPRFYSRGFTVRGTKGLYEEATDSVFLDSCHREFHEKWKEHWGNAAEFAEKYEHPIWKKYLTGEIRGGHDGMDWLVMNAFFDALKNGEPMPIDVYDMASWMVITPLSEISIAKGSVPVEIPDFTNGAWTSR